VQFRARCAPCATHARHRTNPAQTFYLSKQYRRALQLLRRQELVEAHVRFKHLAACCLLECKQWDECLALLGEDAESVPGGVAASPASTVQLGCASTLLSPAMQQQEVRDTRSTVHYSALCIG
jgi:hypothetical protein